MRLIWPWLSALVLTLPACNAEAARFRSIRLGTALTDADLRSAAQPSDCEALVLHNEAGIWPFPAIWAYKQLTVLTDSGGRTIGKSYHDFAMSHWLVAQAAAYHWIVEVQVPEDLFREPPGPGSDEFFRQINQLQEAGRALSDGMPSGARQAVATSRREEGKYIRRIRMPVNPARAKPDELKHYMGYTHQTGTDLDDSLDLSGVDAAALKSATSRFTLSRERRGLFLIAECMLPQGPGTVVDSLVAAMQKLSCPAPTNAYQGRYYAAVFFGLAMCWRVRADCTDLGNYWFDLRGITKTGFDVTIENPGAGTVRVRNLGDRRIRIQFRFLRVYDPLLITPRIEGAGEDPYPRVTRRKLGTPKLPP